jgi:hypothetical protein
MAWAAGDSPDKPVPPCPCFLIVSEIHQGQQREGRVPQPAVAIIPVPHAAYTLRKRGRGSGDDPARRRVGQSLQGDEGSFDCFGPWTHVGTPIAPLTPARFRTLQRIKRVNRRRRSLKRWSVGEDEGNGLVDLDRELADGLEVFAAKRGRASQHQTLRTGDRIYRAVIEPADPWHGRPVVEAHHELSTKNHSP